MTSKTYIKKMCFMVPLTIAMLTLTACSYVGYLELRGDVVNIRLIHYDNPNVGFARDTLGFAIGPGRYKDFDESLVEVLEYLDEGQFESFLAAAYGQSFFEHVAGRPDSANGLIVLVQYESGEFDIISHSFTAQFAADGSFEAYVAAWWDIHNVIHRYFETDITWFMGRTPTTASDFSRLMRTEGLDVTDYSEDVSDIPGIRRKIRAYFPYHHAEAGNFIEFTEFWGHVRSMEAFEAQRAEILYAIGSNHTTQEEQIADYRLIQVHSRGNVYRAERASDVMVTALSVSAEYSEWIEGIFNRLFTERAITRD